MPALLAALIPLGKSASQITLNLAWPARTGFLRKATPALALRRPLALSQRNIAHGTHSLQHACALKTYDSTTPDTHGSIWVCLSTRTQWSTWHQDGWLSTCPTNEMPTSQQQHAAFN